LEYLSFCGILQSLVLQGNPLEFDGDPDSEEAQMSARKKILEIIPSLKVLDDCKVLSNLIEPKNQMIIYPERPKTSYGRRPPSPIELVLRTRSDTSCVQRPKTSHGRDASSELTSG
jgi:hypothetical protein